MLNIVNAKCNDLINPYGVDKEQIRFSWQLISDQKDCYQLSYRIEVIDQRDGTKMWDSGLVESEECISIAYRGRALGSKGFYNWQVTVETINGEKATSELQSFETALQESEWMGQWIGAPVEAIEGSKDISVEKMVEMFKAMVSNTETDFEIDRRLDAVNVYRKTFMVTKEISKARLYITSKGIYDVCINGIQVTDTLMNPGFTNYHAYQAYQTHNIEPFLKDGINVITIKLADGWYKGKFGILGVGNNYGNQLAFTMNMTLAYNDGSEEVIISDDSFKYYQSEIVYSDFLIGERINHNLKQPWNDNDFDDSDWLNVQVLDEPVRHLKGTVAEPVRVVEERTPMKTIKSPKGEMIVDMGQNIVGVVGITVNGKPGDIIKIEHSEVLDREGNFINNITGINRDQTDYFILDGSKEEYFCPLFTFHGFRYVKITKPESTEILNVVGKVIGSDLDTTGYFNTSNEKLNQLQSNIFWSQRGNMLSIPTDCPQRERAGWTGDILIYGATAAFNQNVKSFLKQWLDNLRTEQFDNGLVPIVVPYIRAYEAIQDEGFGTHTSAGWGDVIVGLPWLLYQAYGDMNILKENYYAMEAWMEYVKNEAEKDAKEEHQKYLWTKGFHFGDWCYPSCVNEDGEADIFRSAETTKKYVPATMYAFSSDTMSKICDVLGYDERADYYRNVNQRIKEGFEKEYVQEDGSLDVELQGIYVLVLAMDMVSGEKRKKMAGHLARLIEDNNYRLNTGFLSIQYLFDVLMKYGYVEHAKRILYQEDSPSWFYEINKGATTIWETWTGIQEDGTPGHHSYNHYAFGCIGDWLYRNILGIQPGVAGYKEIHIRPNLQFDLAHAEGSLMTPYGKCSNSWKFDGSMLNMEVEIPVNTKGHVYLPGHDEPIIIGSGKHVFKSIKVESVAV